MKRKALFAIVKIPLGEAPELKALLKEGTNMQEYVEELTSDIKIIIDGEEQEIDEVKAKVEDIEIDEESL